MSAPTPSAADILALIRGAAARWAAGLGTADAASELGIDERTVRRKRAGEQGWGDDEIAAIIAAELDATGSCDLIDQLHQATKGAAPSLAPKPLDQQVLLLGAGLAEASALISHRLADQDLSPRDAGLIADQLREVIGQARSQLKRLDQYCAAAKRGPAP